MAQRLIDPYAVADSHDFLRPQKPFSKDSGRHLGGEESVDEIKGGALRGRVLRKCQLLYAGPMCVINRC